MEISNYIAAAGVWMSQMNIKQAAGFAVAARIAETREQQAFMLQDLMTPPAPATGRLVDISA